MPTESATETRPASEAPGWFAVALIAAVFSGLLLGYEPISGDPDRMYRPLKAELADALREGHLPLWSHRLGLGVPLMAESHVAALYPPNLVLYRLLDVGTAYRLAMFLHQLALVGATYLYARVLGITPWGSGLAGVAFTLCGFQAIHASHEPFYHALPYLPLALWLAEKYLSTGRATFAAWLSLALGAQWTLGHFQIQTWTGLLVGLMALGRLWFSKPGLRRPMVVALAVLGGTLVAAPQLGLSWEFAGRVGQTGRSLAERMFFCYPPAHWVEAVVPRLFRDIKGGPEAPYWYRQMTTGHEAAFYVGTVPLILALVGGLDLGRNRPRTNFFRWLVPVTFALATMPAWWPEGYAMVLKVPGLGFFRSPSRYTLLTSFGLCLLAGQGLDRAVRAIAFRAGFVLATVVLLGGLAFAWDWTHRPEHVRILADSGLELRLWIALGSWIVGLGCVLAWRAGKVGGWAPLLLAGLELTSLYFNATVRWGRAIDLPASSPILSELSKTPGVGRLAGHLDNLPLRAGLTTAWPYTGFNLPAPAQFLKDLQEPIERGTPLTALWFRRHGITHGIWPVGLPEGLATSVRIVPDPALDALVYAPSGQTEKRPWHLATFGPPWPEARVATRWANVPDWRAFAERASSRDDPAEAIYVANDAPPMPAGARPATVARATEWSGLSGTVEHDGVCDLILTRAYDPGWKARINGGPEVPLSRVEGGLQSLRLPGKGPSRIVLRYAPAPLIPGAIVSGVTVLGLVGVIAAGKRLNRKVAKDTEKSERN